MQARSCVSATLHLVTMLVPCRSNAGCINLAFGASFVNSIGLGKCCRYLLPIDIREVLQTEFRKLRRKRAAAGCESRKIMAHLSENPSESFGSTGREPNKIFGWVLWSAAVPRSFQHCIRPIYRDYEYCVHGCQSTNAAKASQAAGLLSQFQ